jgi:hypothetical protein
VAEDKSDAGAQACVKAKLIAREAVPLMTALDELIEDANERKACAERNYPRSCRPDYGSKDVNGLLPMVDDIVKLVQEYPTTNECTHFFAVMDPIAGESAWCRYWRRPIED